MARHDGDVSNLPPPNPGGSGPLGPDPQNGPSWSQPATTPSWEQAPAPVGWSGPGQVPTKLGGAFYSPGLVILLSIVTIGIWTLVWSYRTGEDLKKHNRDGLGGGLMLLLAVIVSPAVMFLVPDEIETMYRRDGRESPVKARLGLWFLLPIIGNLIWYFKVQRALNDFWTSKGSQPG